MTAMSNEWVCPLCYKDITAAVSVVGTEFKCPCGTNSLVVAGENVMFEDDTSGEIFWLEKVDEHSGKIVEGMDDTTIKGA